MEPIEPAILLHLDDRAYPNVQLDRDVLGGGGQIGFRRRSEIFGRLFERFCRQVVDGGKL